MLDHESHEFGGIAADAEKFQPILFDEPLEGGVRCYTYTVPVGVPQYLAQRNEGLDIAARAHDLYNNVQSRRWRLPRVATKTRRNVGGRERRGGGGKSVLPKLVAQGRSDNIGESTARLVDVDIDSAVVCAERRTELVARFP